MVKRGRKKSITKSSGGAAPRRSRMAKVPAPLGHPDADMGRPQVDTTSAARGGVHPDEDYSRPKDRRDHSRQVGGLSNLANVQRLRDSMEWSAQSLRIFHEKHTEAVRRTAGNRYGASELQKSPLNIMRLAMDIWLRQLVSQTPKSLVVARNSDNKIQGYELQLALDYLFQQIRLGDTLSDAVISAIFSMGIVKVGITSPYMKESVGFLADAGHPYAEPVLFEDWLHDMNARRKEEWDWCANRYRVPYEHVIDNPEFNSKVKDRISPSDKTYDNITTYADKTSSMSTGTSISDTEYIQHVELWDIWIPLEKRVVTMPVQQGLGVLQTKEWEGPENGPYHLLGFSKIPGNILPLAPAQNLYDMQQLMTSMFAQIGEQSTRQKTILFADGRAESDGMAEAVVNASDGDVIRVDNTDSVKEVRMGGADQVSVSILQWLRELSSYLAGNIDAIGGLSPQAETLGQEKLLVGSSSEMIRQMQSHVIQFTTEITESLGYWVYSDPASELPLVKKIPGYGEVPFTYGPEDRQEGILNFQFQIMPYTLRHKGPEERLQAMSKVINQILPLMPQAQEMGVTLRLDKFMEYLAKYSDMPELEEIISIQDRSFGQPGVGPQVVEKRRPLQSPSTSRNYTNTNISQKSGLSAVESAMAKATPPPPVQSGGLPQ